MRFAKVDARHYCGIDLHSRSMYVCVMDREGEIRFHRNLPNNFDIFHKYINPFLPDMAVGVESSCYYYWLADSCREAGIPFYLGHAYYMKSIHGGKVKNDKVDSKKIADLLRCNLFPLAYPYPREMRPTRDLLRRRHYFMWRRASTYSHLQLVCAQHGIVDLASNMVKDKSKRNQLLKLFDDKELQMMISLDLLFIEFLDPLIAKLERHIRQQARYHSHLAYQILRSIPGVGEILALIILYETHDIKRFKTVQRYSSYSGVVKCDRESGGKKMSAKNTKIRNPYLKWAFGEIILKAQVCEPKIAKLYNRMKSKYGVGRAKSIMAHRFAVATYFMLKNKQAFDVDRFVQTSK
ncbi:IS110 family transposase [candidate division KSB1 bacterium]|nr:IS110 family transposase [candidate division KSB1 bacterium]